MYELLQICGPTEITYLCNNWSDYGMIMFLLCITRIIAVVFLNSYKNLKWKREKSYFRASKMTRQVRVLATMSKNLSLVPRTHMV